MRSELFTASRLGHYWIALILGCAMLSAVACTSSTSQRAGGQTTPTPVVRTYDLHGGRIEVGCGVFCSWYYTPEVIKRTNDPQLDTDPLGVGQELVLVRVSVDPNGHAVALTPEQDFHLAAGGRTVDALPASRLRTSPTALSGEIKSAQTGWVGFKLAHADAAETLFFRKEAKTIDVRDSAAPSPTPTPTPAPAVLIAQLDAAWAAEDWDTAIKTLAVLRRVDSNALDFDDKFYAAYFYDGQARLARGDTGGAREQFSKAVAIDASRAEAQEALQPLIPTPTPTSAQTAPAPTPRTAPTQAPTVAPISQPRKEDSVYVDPRLLVSDPHRFVGVNVYIQGRALNVQQNQAEPSSFFTAGRAAYTWVQLLAQVRGKGTTESVVVEFSPRIPSLLKDECYRFYALGDGSQTVRRTLTGAENEAPVLQGYAASGFSPQSQKTPSLSGCPDP